jgi:hypothetical protein
VHSNFLQEVEIDDDEAFTQVKVTIKIASAPGSSWFTNPTLLLDSTIRLSHEWLDRGAADILWLDDAKSFGLRVQPHPKEVLGAAEETSYYDLEVDGKGNLRTIYPKVDKDADFTELHLQATRFLAAVREAERKEEKETVLNPLTFAY